MQFEKAVFAKTLFAAASLLFSMAGYGQPAYPNKPIKLIVPFPPGGGTDVMARMLADRIATSTGWNILIDNKPGASGNIGLDAVAKSAPDGYTIGMGQTANLAVNPHLYAKMSYDSLKDFSPIALVATQPVVLVVAAKSPFKTVADVVAAAKAKADGLNMANPSNGTVGHLSGELFARVSGGKFLQVPYKGATPIITDMIGGSVDMFFANPLAVIPQIKGGSLRALGVTSSQRLASLPQVPTIIESGYPGFETANWSGLVAPAGTPKEIIARLNAEVEKALGKQETIDKLAFDGSTPIGGSPQKFGDYLRGEHAKWGKIIRDAGIKLE
ncbi:MAG: tripartite tricarboxylate transporter substrate binding protein [Usitatibacteraceae bacterium]